MGKKRRVRWDRVLGCAELLGWILITGFIIWLVVSYLNVVLHNKEFSPLYENWNFFMLVF